MKFCANLSFMFMEGVSFLSRYMMAKEAGFRLVETGFPVGFTIEEVKAAKDEAAINQALINLYTGDTSQGELGVTFDPNKTQEFKDRLKLTIEYAKALDVPMVHVMAGILKDPVQDYHWNTYESNLAYAANEFERENIIGVIEPINNHTVPFYFMNSYEKAIDIIKSINNPHLRLMMDLFHLQQIKGDLTNSIKEFLPYTGHVQIAQVPNRNEPNTPGELDYKYILDLLESLSYKGMVGLEYRPLNGTVNGLKWIEDYGFDLKNIL